MASTDSGLRDTSALQAKGGDESTMLGVKVEGFLQLCRKLGLDVESNITGPEVQAKVRELTTKSKKSALRHVLEGGADFADVADLIGAPTMFLSHSWKFELREIIAALRECSPEEVVWFDLFSVPQHGGAAKPFSWWQDTFFAMVKSIGKVAMVMMPYDHPVTLTRAWCCFELYACIETGSAFDVIMPDNVRKLFLQALKEDVKIFWRVISGVRTAECEAGDPEDRRKIGAVIEQAGGFGKIDGMVVSKLKGWLVRVLEEQISRTAAGERAGFLHTLGQLCWLDGKYAEAERLLKEAWEERQRLLGEEHTDTLWSMAWLGRTYRLWSRLGEAEEILARCMELQRVQVAQAGAEEYRMLCTMCDLGFLYGLQPLRAAEGETLLVECVERSETALGRCHDLTLVALNNLSSTYEERGELGKAIEMQEDCVARRREADGPSHPETLIAMANLASKHSQQGAHDKAGQIETVVLERCREVLGERHPETLVAMYNLGATYYAQKRLREAEELFGVCVARMETVLPPDHQHRQNAAGWLAAARAARAAAASAMQDG